MTWRRSSPISFETRRVLKGGLSMTIAVQTLASSEYGTMNDEVKKMSHQLSWGIPSAMRSACSPTVSTPLVKRAISLIQEAN